MRILIIHPEGNIHNNPNLTGIVDILCDCGCTIEVMSPRRREIYQGPLRAGARLTLLEIPWRQGPFIFVSLEQAELNDIPATVNSRIADVDFVFGVDMGIVEASLIAKVKRIPHALISYELFFADETGPEFKRWEINACVNLAFAICQDEVRSRLLSEENNIPPDRIVNIPVVGRGFRRAAGCDYLRNHFRISAGARIALYMGSLQEWAMSGYLAESASQWPDDWRLILHNRYQNEPYAQMLNEKYRGCSRIIFSNEPFNRQDEMNTFISSADIGISLYKPDYNSIYTGKNLEFVGMASGKTNAYFQHGVPVITNDDGVMGHLVREHNVGIVVDTARLLTLDVATPELNRMKAAVPEFFRCNLDLDLLMKPVLTRLGLVA
jgi:hypothetical protein